MGAQEAIQILDVLYEHRAATTGAVREYVVRTLYGGPDMADGRPQYDALCTRFFRELPRSEQGGEPRLSNESVDYLRRVLESAAGGGRGLSRFDGQYDGFSRQAFEEVLDLLGPGGRGHYGISAAYESLMPDPGIVLAILQDESEAERSQEEAGRRVPSGEQWDLTWGPPDTWDQGNPVFEPLPDFRETMSWEPHWPELDPLPRVEGFGPARASQDER